MIQKDSALTIRGSQWCGKSMPPLRNNNMGKLQEDNIITVAQLGVHNSEHDLWVAVHGKVFDLTSFANDHPGGIDVLKDCAGTDGSEVYDYAGHSPENEDAMQRFRVGSLAGYSTDAARTDDIVATTSSTSSNDNDNTNPTLRLSTWGRLLLVVTVLGAVSLYLGLGRERGPSQGVNSANSFLGGLLIALSMSGTCLAILYSQFSKTLKHGSDVFSYPAVIPRKAGRACI